MSITVSYYGSKKPGPGVKPIRVETLHKLPTKDKTPFGQRNPINWMTGKHMALRRDSVSASGQPSADENSHIRLHLIDSVDDHAGVDKKLDDALVPIENGLLFANANGLPEDSGVPYTHVGLVLASATDEDIGHLDDKCAKSIVVDTNKLQLSGDSATPGADKLYGTNGSGVKGWIAIPSGSAVVLDYTNVKATGGDYSVTGHPEQLDTSKVQPGEMFYIGSVDTSSSPAKLVMKVMCMPV